MDIKINQTQPINQIDQTKAPQPTDGNFKFTLISSIGEAALAEKLSGCSSNYLHDGRDHHAG